MKTKSANGFTLVEVLVVIAITGMISVLVLQMLTILFRGYDQIGRIQAEVSLDTMRFGWFRNSVGVLVASLDEEFAFFGNPEGFTGFTVAPLIGRQGKVSAISWELRDDPAGPSLWYVQRGVEPMRIGQWPDGKLEFAYRGHSSNWRSDWPPEELAEGVLPHRIKLMIAEGGSTQEVYAAINVRRTGRYDYRDFLN